MGEKKGLDLQNIINEAMVNVFDTMLSMNIEMDDENAKENQGIPHIVGTVGFAGKVMGNINVNLKDDFARLITAEMLGMEIDEIESDEDVYDVVGELCNMIGGDLKSRLCDLGLTCELSIPSVTGGSDFKTETKGWDRSECLCFKCREYTALVQLYIKAAK